MTSKGNEAVSIKRVAELAYPTQLEPEEDGGYVVTFPDFGIGVTQGDTREQALAQADDLLETMVANYMAEGWDLPEPSPARGRSFVRLAPLVAAKAEVYRAMRQTGIEGVLGLSGTREKAARYATLDWRLAKSPT